MAVDTRDKRFSILGMASAFVRLLQNPSGTIAQSGRQCLEFLYSGILAGAAAVLGVADLCDTFAVAADLVFVVSAENQGFTVSVDPVAFAVAIDPAAFVVPGCQ